MLPRSSWQKLPPAGEAGPALLAARYSSHIRDQWLNLPTAEEFAEEDPARPTRAGGLPPSARTPTPDALADLLNPGIGAHGGPRLRHQTSAAAGQLWTVATISPPPRRTSPHPRQSRRRGRASTRRRLSRASIRNWRWDWACLLPPYFPHRGEAARPAAEKTTPNIACRAPICRRSRAALPASRPAVARKTAARGRPEFSAPCRGRRTGRRGRRNPKAACASSIKSDFEPKGDQPQAIEELVEGVKRHDRTQVLLGVTGSGKTFTMAKVIEATQRPALILAPNKTLAAQLYGEFKSSSPTTRSSISSPTTTITSRKPTSRAPTPISRRNPRSTSRSTACATRRRARCSSATTSSSSPRCRASTASARSRPIRR